jgi:pyruvate/2-oxoglutarate/acetoin dehydrogenase E1 component
MAKPLTYAQAYREGLSEEMERDARVFVVGTDVVGLGGHFGQVTGLAGVFGPERIRDAPISECAIVASGVGAALNGMRPVVDVNFIDFAFGAMDEIVNQAAKMRYMLNVPLPLVIRASIGAARYGAQHNNSVETWFAHMPGLLVAVPSTPSDVKGLIKTSLRGADPVMFLMHKKLGGARGEVEGPDYCLPFGQATVRRPGSDVTVVSFSVMVGQALKAAETMAARGVDVEVIDLRTLVPLDLHTIETSVRKTRRLVLVEEAPRFGGFTAEVAATIQESLFGHLEAPVIRVGALHAPIPHSPPLIEAIVPQPIDIEKAIEAVLSPLTTAAETH